MGSAIGRVHANRVSADAGLSWTPGFPLPYYDKWNLPCARNMVRNSICRMTMHGRWWINDPDCMLLRATTSFSEDEIVGIATVKALSGGSFIISDDLAAVPARRLRLAQQLLPATNRAAIPLDLMEREMPELLRLYTCVSNIPADPWTLLAVCNWGDTLKLHHFAAKDTHLLEQPTTPVVATVATAAAVVTVTAVPVSKDVVDKGANKPKQILHILEFWSGVYTYKVVSATGKDDDLHFPSIAVHSAKLYAIRRLKTGAGVAQYLGSNLHFSSGMEVSRFQVGLNKGGPANCSHMVRIGFEAGALREESWGGFVWVYLSHSAVRPCVVGAAGSQLPVLASSIDEAECGAKGAVWKIAVSRGHNAVADADDTVLIYW
jgi:hypothetical protein